METGTPLVGIPFVASDVTPAWLTAALQRDFPGANATTIRGEDLHDGTALTRRLHVTYSGPVAGPPTVCLKAGLDAPHRELIFGTGLFSKEARVYRDLLPKMSVRVATCFSADFDSSTGRGYAPLEDLEARGATFCASDEPMTIDEVASGLEQLAGLHAALWRAPAIGAVEWRHRGRALDEDDPAEAYMLSMIPAAAHAPHAGAVARLFHDPVVLGPAIARLRAIDHASAACLIHGDAHVGNFFKDARGDVGMADFQCVQRGHFTHDLALFVGSSLDVIDRRRAERELIDHYLNTLGDHGVDAPPTDEAWLGYRRHMLYGLWAWLLTTTRYQTERRLVTTVFRYGIAALDLDSLAAIGTS